MKIHTSFSSLAAIPNPVVTIGTFDGVHLGHYTIINRLKEIAHEVKGQSVLLTFYPHPRMVLHPEDHNIELLNSPEEKSELLERAGIEHLVIYPFSTDFSRMSPFEYVRDLLVTGIHAHTVVVGYDHRFGRNREGDHKTLVELSETFGFHVEEISAKVIDEINISSTKIRQNLKQGNVNDAARFLGYGYTLSGKVVRGDAIGRTLGFPTANIAVDYPFKLVPARGIYAVHVFVKGRRHKGVVSIGVRPTVVSNSAETIEVYIMDFNDDIYDEKISIEFIKYIREEKTFGSINELKENIANDVAQALLLF